jgi:putative transposase
MARPLRIQYPGAMYHIISRGIGRMTIFHNEKDWKKFIQFMERVIEKYNWICHAYCLMGTHYHILLETPDANMVVGMKYLNQLYSQFYNWKYQRVGPVLQGRYKAWLVEKEEKFLDNSRYIVNNPVKAKMVQHPSEWPWSSFRATRGLEKVPGYLETDFLLRHFSSSRKKAQKMYEDFVLDGIGMESPLMEAKNQIFLGSDSFIAEAMQHADCTGILIDIPRTQKLAARPTLVDIFENGNRTSKKLRNLRIKEAFEKHQYTLREIGQHLQLHPDYLSRLMHEMRKTSEGRT